MISGEVLEFSLGEGFTGFVEPGPRSRLSRVGRQPDPVTIVDQLEPVAMLDEVGWELVLALGRKQSPYYAAMATAPRA